MSAGASDDTFVVVVGASAGGIDALRQFVGGLPAGFPAPIVVAQHLASDRESHLAEILHGAGPLPVESVDTNRPLLPGRIYVVAGHEHVSLVDHAVRLEFAEPRQSAPSVDRLLITAAEAVGDRLIAVILSGMGSDGAVGAREVRARGGTVVIQDPETAAYPSMPRSLPPAIVDFVSAPAEMGVLLTGLTAQPPAGQEPGEEDGLSGFFEELRQQTGIDFGAYKRPTLLRRLQRRVVATGSPGVREYLRLVRSQPEEYARLASTFLIKVTQFFRDPELYDHLRDVLLPRLVADAGAHGNELRLWSAGCATGEEAYSLAILVAEVLGDDLGAFSVRVFATDLDEAAVAFARRGIYPAGALADVPPEIVDKYFIRDGTSVEIGKRIRSLVVFGQHDLAQRAPFPRIDLTTCRNVLIYFTPELQKRALQLFAYSLREGGLLVLGKAETTTPLPEHFVTEDAKLKVYRRTGPQILVPPGRIRSNSGTSQSRRRDLEGLVTRRTTPPQTPPALRDHAETLLLHLPVGVVVVDRSYDISVINAGARRLLGIHAGALGQDLIHLAHALPSEELRNSIDRALAGDVAAMTATVTRPDGVEPRETVLQLEFAPHRRDEGSPVVGALVTVADVTPATRELRRVVESAERSNRQSGLIREDLERVARANRELLAANEELTNTNLMLRSGNEDLLVAAEEVQAASEEAETLNEELQATNEELETLNEELQATVEELNTTNDDLEARSAELGHLAATLEEQRSESEVERLKLFVILDSLTDAVVAVNGRGEPVMTNRAFDELMEQLPNPWVPEDESGQPLAKADWPQSRAGQGEGFVMTFAVAALDGTRRWFEASSRGGAAGQEWTGVVVLRDITDRSIRRLLEGFLAAASHELRTPAAAVHGYLQLAELRVDEDGDEARRYLALARRETRELGELVSRLFDVALAQQGRMSMRREPVDLAELVVTATEAVRAANPGSTVAADVQPAITVVGDGLRLRQAVINLVTNAVTHGAGDRAEVALRLRDGGAELEVADRGPGLSAPTRDRLWEPFVVGDHESTPLGLGLGLYLTREIVEAHGGDITVEGRDGGGTTVFVRIPASIGHEGGAA